MLSTVFRLFGRQNRQQNGQHGLGENVAPDRVGYWLSHRLALYSTARKRHANQPVANRDDTKPGSPDQSRQRVRPPTPERRSKATTLFLQNPTTQASLKKPRLQSRLTAIHITENQMSTSPAFRVSTPERAPDVLEHLSRSERLMTARELASILAISPKTIYSYAERNMIPHFRIEANVRFRGRDIAEWLRNHASFRM